MTHRETYQQSATYSTKFISKPLGTESLPNSLCIMLLVFSEGINKDSHKLVKVQMILDQIGVRIELPFFKICLNEA